MEILKNLEIKIRERAKLLLSAEKDDNVKKTLFSICKRDPVYFFKYFVYTDRNPTLIPQKFGSAVPFILFDYQEEFLLDAWDAILMAQLPVKERTNPTDIFSEKSRQMWFSWTFAGLQVYSFIFHDMKSLYLSLAADEVDKNWDMKSQFEKIRFILSNLPNWMLPTWFNKKCWTEYNKYMVISRSDWTWSIKWECSKPTAWRWWTTAFAIFDEMAFMSYAWQINASVWASTPCRFFNSTPNWEWNEYYLMRKRALPVDEYWNKKEQTVRYHKCHWSEHPLYDDDWYNWKTKNMSADEIAAELEIDYNVAIKGRVYSWFKWHTHDVDYNPVKPLYIIIDNSHGGQDPHAVIIMQPNYDSTYWDIIDSIEINCDIPEMADFLTCTPKFSLKDNELAFLQRYKEYNWRTAVFVSDPYDTHTRIVNNHHPDWIVIFEEYTKVWINLNIPNTKDNPKTTQIIRTRSNINRLRINKRCIDFISAIQNAAYPDENENSRRTTPIDMPNHDWTSHYRTALEYMTIYMLDNFVETQKDKEKEDVFEMQEFKNPVTGEISYNYNV